MNFNDFIQNTQIHFPNIKIKYKTQSLFMRILGFLLFFNKDFMKSYTTTIGNSIYFPSKLSVAIKPISSSIVLMHELMHVKDNKSSFGLFSLLYLLPQLLILLFFPLLFISWKIALIALIFAAPLPAFFRMHYEKKAYMLSLYAIHQINQKGLNFYIDLDTQKDEFLKQFHTSTYYWMWPFKNINKEFEIALIKIKVNNRPFEDPIFDIIDELILKM